MSTDRPIRLAFLGGTCTGKTSLLSRLTIDLVREVHYPTKKQSNWLFTFKPHSRIARAILDEKVHERYYYENGNVISEAVFKSPSINDNVLLSPLVYQSIIEDYNYVKSATRNGQRLSDAKGNLRSENTYYQYITSTEGSSHHESCWETSPTDIPLNYVPPEYSDIAIDVIDTPGFDPNMVVPFLEVSLFRNLDSSILRGLADQPREPVSTQSMLVASGSAELNGKVDGYILVYSALPELTQSDPPPYDEPELSAFRSQKQTPYSTTSAHKHKDGGFSLLKSIKDCFLDAWTEFRNYQRNCDVEKECDIYSLSFPFKQTWKTESQSSDRANESGSFKSHLEQLDLNPESPDSPPPILIVCTHVMNPLHSPLLIEEGKNLAIEWNCAFVAVDSMLDVNVDIALACIIRDIIEKEKLMKRHMTKKKGVLERIIKG
ncbi:HBL109Wp [Eremothecium sinecaudum]|uniref:HBL109Wp n=1 Tax=Eremothecium sinecaudum TaxID=45286 RepID=A0A109UWE6_9SACH|nr:HBL109Wp [Eremothecium sinecaudum]AMD18793.1 HBL109Wp [Eremothecium sinecaudum]